MKFSNFLVSISFILILVYSISFSKWDIPYGNSLISWDACGYYSYLPAYFYDDLYHPDKTGDIVREQSLMGGDIPFHYVDKTGRAVMRYPIGEAFAFMPAFGIAHIVAKDRSGFSRPYQLMCGIWGLFLSLVGILSLRKLLLRYFEPITVGLLIFTLVWGTNYLHYAGGSVLHTHNLLFTCYALLCLWVDTIYRRVPIWTPSRLLMAGLFCGWMAIMRPTDALAILIPLFWGSHSWQIFRDRIIFWWRHVGLFIYMMAAMFLISFVQMAYWHHATGNWIYNSYREELNFSFLHPHLFDYLFSYMKGWFTYTPVMIFSLVGLALILYKKILHAFLIAIFITLTIYVLSAWDVWWYGGSFSQRSIIQSYVLLSFPLAYLIHLCRLAYWSRLVMGIILSLIVYTNLVMHYQVTFSDSMETSAMSKTYYWKIFWHWNSPSDWRRYIDVKPDMPESYAMNLKLVDSLEFDSGDTSLYYTPPASYRTLETTDFVELGKIPIPHDTRWVRATAWVYLRSLHWDGWRHIEISLTQKKNGESRQNNATIRPLRFLFQSYQWLPIYWDLEIKPNQGDTLFISTRNDRVEKEKLINIDNIRVYMSPSLND